LIYLRYGKKLFVIRQGVDLLLLAFLGLIFLSWALQEEVYDDTIKTIKLMAQYTYWVVVALFIKTWIYQYSFYKVSRIVFFASVIAVVYYIFLNPFHPIYYPNSFAYTIVSTLPIGFYYVMRRFSLITVLAISAFFVIAVLYSGSRTGSTLTLFEIVTILGLTHKAIKKAVLTVLFFVVPLVYLGYVSVERNDIRDMKLYLADSIESISPKIAYTLRMEENVFERDKSLLIRKLMIQKAEKIFDEHPFFGIGPGNFTKYRVDLDIIAVSHWLNQSQENYNKRSSQNSYIMILAENGIFALAVIALIFLWILIRGFHYVYRFENSAEVFVYITFIALIFYGFILVTTMGTLFWFVLGLALTLTQRKRRLR
jgi:O-antigen ligase